MKKQLWKRILWIIVGLVFVGLIVVSLLPQPLPVDAEEVIKGPLHVAIEAEGKTRVEELFVVTAPVTGLLKRIGLEEGDSVGTGMTIASITPPPADRMQRSELEARIGAIEANREALAANVQQVRSQLEQAQTEANRMKQLRADGAVSQQTLENAQQTVTSLLKSLEAAEARVRSAENEKRVAESGRMAYSGSGQPVNVPSPVRGRVLRIMEENERVVMAGTPLLSIGDPNGLEIEVDVLSTDAVKITPGDRIVIEGWGGEEPLEGRVKYIEPSAFTKISALGIEEQRVFIIGEFLEYPKKLGDGYRIVASIITWEADDVLKVPASALFRDEEGWGVFVVDGGIVHKKSVKTGHRNSFEVEILEGLQAGEKVVIHPSNQVEDGIEAVIQQTEE